MPSDNLQKIKVAIFSMPMNCRGGGYDIIRNWLLTLDKDVFDVHFICFSYCLDNLQEKLNDVPNIKFIHIAKLNSLKYLYVPGIIKLFKYLKSEKIDVLHTVMIQADILGGIAAKLAGVPVSISTVIGYLINPTPGLFMRLKTRVYKIGYWLIKDRFDCITTISKATSDELKEDFNVKKEKLLINYCGIKLYKNRHRKKKSLKSENLVVGAIGELIPQKGMMVFLRSIPSILEIHPSTKFIIAGDGYEKTILEEMALNLRIDQKVRFLGWVSNAREVIESMDIFVFPSLPKYDGLPRVILEAWAMGTPVIATNVACVPEIVKNGEDGLVVRPGSESDISNAVNLLISDREKADSLAEKGFKRVLEYDKDIEVKKIEEIYYRYLFKKGFANIPIRKVKDKDTSGSTWQ